MADITLVFEEQPISLALTTATPINLVLDGGATYTAGTGISIAGAVITNTAPNIVQELSIAGQDLTLSGGGGTVAIPGVSWPLLAPDGTVSAPSYSFANKTDAGLWYESGIVNLSSNADDAISIRAGSGDTGGSITMVSGAGASGNGGDFVMEAGSSDSRAAGVFTMTAGSASGSGRIGGGFNMFAGSGLSGNGGPFNMSAGSSQDGNGGDVVIGSGSSTNANGGNIELIPGAGVETGKIITYGLGVVLPNLTASQVSAISAPSVGQTVFCTDATANDSSTGVMQVYNGSTWKNAW